MGPISKVVILYGYEHTLDGPSDDDDDLDGLEDDDFDGLDDDHLDGIEEAAVNHGHSDCGLKIRAVKKVKVPLNCDMWDPFLKLANHGFVF